MKTAILLLSLIVPSASQQQDVVAAPAITAPLRMSYEPAPEEIEAVQTPIVVVAEHDEEDAQ